MALNFASVSNDQGLTQLNNYLAGNTYVFGFSISSADAQLFAAFNGNSPDASKYPNVARYLAHIATYSAAERSAAPAIDGLSVTVGATVTSKKAKKADDDDEDMDVDGLFGSDDDDSDDESEDLAAIAAAKAAESKAKAKEAMKKSHKRPALAKSRVVFEVKPYDAETDLEALATKIKAIKLEGPIGDPEDEFAKTWEEKLEDCEDERCSLEEGAKWGEGHRLDPLAFGIFKLIVQVTIHDELVGSDDLIDVMMFKFADEIQSIEVAAFDKAS